MSSFLTVLLALPGNAGAQASREGPSFTASAAILHRYPDASYDPNNQVYFAVIGANPIKARFITLDGVPLGSSSFKIPQTTEYTQVPRVAFGSNLNGGNGAFLVTWLDNRTGSASVFGRIVALGSNGSPSFLTNDFQISSGTGAYSESAPAVAYAANLNRFLVVWRRGPPPDIRGRLVAGDGSVIGAEIPITNDALGQSQPSVAYNPGTQEFEVVYAGWTQDSALQEPDPLPFVRAQRVDGENGAILGGALTIDSGGSTYLPQVIFDGTQYFAVWFRSSVFYGRFLTGAGALSGNIVALATKAIVDGLGLARNPVSDTYFLVTQDHDSYETLGFQISSTGATEPKFRVTDTGNIPSGNFNPRITATTDRPEWLAVTANSYNRLIGQRVKTAGFTGGPPPPPPPPPNCSYSVSPTSKSVAAAGESFNISVTTTTGCTWTAGSNQGFVTFSSGASGTGSGTATSSVAANSGSARSATLTVAGKSVSVSQSASSGSGGGGSGLPAPLPADQWDTVVTTVGDYNGDGASDATVFRSTTANWFIRNQSNISWGSNQPSTLDQPVPADYDGDGKTDAAVFRRTTNTWQILYSSNGQQPSRQISPSTTFDVPVPADYDGDGKADIAVYHRTTGYWDVIQSSNNVQKTYRVGVDAGTQAFVPVPGDYNGDGKAEPAVYLTTTGQWSVLGSSMNKQVGAANVDMPVPADYDGDGKTDMAVFNLNTAIWKIDYSGPTATFNQNFGATGLGDVPVPGDYDGDGKADIAVFRTTTSYWLIKNSSGGNSSFQWPTSPNASDIVHLP